MILVPPVNTSARYTLIPRFAALNGIYTLTKIMSFDAAIEEKVNFTDTLYGLVGLTEDDYNAEWSAYQTGQILRLTRCRDQAAIAANTVGQVIHVPESLLQYVPDPMVRPYEDIYLAIDVGPYADPEKIDILRVQLNDLASAVTGTTNTAALMSIGQIWLSDTDYAALAAERAGRIQQLTPQATTIQTLQTEVARLKSLVATYETTLVALSNS